MKINSFSFPIYGTIIIISFFIGLIYIYYSLKKDNYKDKTFILYAITFVFFSLVFAKIITLINSPTSSNILNVGLSSYGGVIGAILASFIYEKAYPTNNKIIVYTIISLPLIYGLSKIACFLVGCCHGIPYNGILSVTYVDDLNIELFPIQLLETIVFLILFFIFNKLKYNKNIIYIVLLVSSLSKFSLDFLRYDHMTKIITFNQIISIIIFICTISLYLYKKKFNK